MDLLAKRLLLLFVFALPLMNPALHYPVVLADAVFVLLAAAFGAALLARHTRLRWRRPYWVLVLYLAALAVTVPFSEDAARSAAKLGTQGYLVSLALVADALIDDEADLRRVVLAWLAATLVVVLIGLASVASFLVAPDNALLAQTRYRFGTLPAGDYPRLALTFANANMLANWLTVSIGLTLLAAHLGWIGRGAAAVLGGGILLAAAFTFSPGLGGIALAIGLWFWLVWRARAPLAARLALAAGAGAALLFVAAMCLTPILHPTAPWTAAIGGIAFAPSGRLMIWSDAAATFAAHPLTGRGLGLEAANVRFMDPTGHLQWLTDAHNSFLSIAAQAGLVGLAGFVALLLWVLRASLPWRLDSPAAAARTAFALLFLNALAYQGLGGSFEDMRHLWLLLGLFLATRRLASPNPS